MLILLLVVLVALIIAAIAALLQGAVLVGLTLLVLGVPTGGILAVLWLRREVSDSWGFRRATRQMAAGTYQEPWRRKV